MENSLHYGEIGEMADRSGGGQEMKNSLHFGEIGEMRGPIRGGVRKWRIRCILEKSEKCADRLRGRIKIGEFGAL